MFKRISIIFVLLLIVLSCNKQKDSFPIKIGQTLDKSIIEKFSIDVNSKKGIQISASSILRSYEINYNNNKFSIAVNDENKIIFISTFDKGFMTSEGVLIEKSTFNDVLKYTSKGLVIEGGWICYVPLTSGWNAVVDNSNFPHLIEIPLNRKVIYLFKRH